MNRKAIIPTSALLTFGTITLADLQKSGRLPGTKEWLGFVVVYTIISAGSDFGIPVAGGFAILVLLTVLLTRGLEALEFITGKITVPKGRAGRHTPKRIPSRDAEAKKV